ncbi:MAG: flagellar motor protein MotB [Chitinophagaceae bacterium]|nr:flagellar motor protein MotB [Chitinophagaceae bacterium]
MFRSRLPLIVTFIFCQTYLLAQNAKSSEHNLLTSGNAQYEQQGNQKAIYKEDARSWQIKYLAINTAYNEYGPQPRGQGLVFISDRPSGKERRQAGVVLPFSVFYNAPDIATLKEGEPIIKEKDKTKKLKKDASFLNQQTSLDNDKLAPLISVRTKELVKDSNSVLFNVHETTGFNLGPMSFSPDGTTLFYTRNKKQKHNNVFGLEIVEAKMENNEWKVMHTWPDASNASSFFHPAITADGKRLFFSSNMPGGMGGIDIYYSDLTEKGWSSPVNCGIINTAGNEEFPYSRGDTLYFSSDRPGGLGGLDIYRAVKTDTCWLKPGNLGNPVNSSFDDFGISWDYNNDAGYFSSNRFGSDDIFSFTHKLQLVEDPGKQNTVLTQQTAGINADPGRGKEQINSVVPVKDSQGNYKSHP